MYCFSYHLLLIPEFHNNYLYSKIISRYIVSNAFEMSRSRANVGSFLLFYNLQLQ